MKEKKRFPKYLPVMTAVMLLFMFCVRTTYAESKIFSGVSTSIVLDKTCKEKPEHVEFMLVFDEESKDNSSGWFFGKGTTPAEFSRISPTHFEISYPATRYHNLPSSLMEIQPVEGGLRAVVRDHVHDENEVRESLCFFEKMEVDLKPGKGSGKDMVIRAKEIFTADLIMLEGDDLLFKQNEYRKAEAQGYKALPIYERIFGRFSKEAFDASALIALSLIKLERFDEALEVIAPYRKALPENTDLKKMEEASQQLKKNQEDLFRYDPDGKSNIDLEPIA